MRVALLVALALAGCAAPAALGPADLPAAGAPIPAFGSPLLTGLACDGECFEPTVAADRAGRLFATDVNSAEVAVSTDNGTTWTMRPAPPIPERLPGYVSDVLVQVSPDDRLYYSALVIRRTGVGFLLEGIQVAWSDDGARTWAGNTVLSLLDSPGAPVVYPDRQWLGFGADGEVYLTYNQIPSGIWIARSDDDGRTWSGWTRVAAFEERRGLGQSGPPVVDADGRVHVPGCVLATGGLAVYSSGDGGRTFTRSDVPAEDCSWFPIVAVSPAGGLVAAWTGESGTLWVSASDEGASWSEPAEWGAGSLTSPWPLVAADGSLDVVWIGGSGVLRLASGDPAAAPGREIVVAEGLGGSNTHFAHGARLADGRLATIWADGDAILAALQLAAS